MSAPIERTVRIATRVDDLPAAWAFIMAHIDAVGPRARVAINPYHDADDVAHFDVAVEGMVIDA